MDWDTPVTLFIANIAATLPDSFVRRILSQCGTVLRWHRASGVKKEPCDFGFVDFGSPHDAILALRVLPHVRILELTWEVRIDSEKSQDLASFDQMRSMRADFDSEKELRKDQLIMHMVSEMIDASAFAQAVPRLEGVLFSANDEAREAENYRYLKDVKRENDELEAMFRDALVIWKKEENIMEREREMGNHTRRAKRAMFLAAWREPDADTKEQKVLFDEARAEIKALRQEEEAFERELTNDSV